MRIPIKTTIGVFAASALTLGASIALPGLAGAAPKSVTATTRDIVHPDTTSVSGPCTGISTNGPTWATDNLSFKFIVTPYATTPTDGADYTVTINATGRFKATADPTTGNCASFNGSVNGTIQYDVSSSNPPNPANLPSQSPDTSQDTMLSELFGGYGTGAGIVGGGHYSYTYTSGYFPGGTYSQVG